jgi:pimeloyl-ACP methyl ester carboxylesterase
MFLRVLCLSYFLTVQSVAQESISLIEGEEYIKANLMVEVSKGRRLNLYCTGRGHPTVILESGLTEPINNWGLVQPLISKSTRVCSYDRAGVGFSDKINRESTSSNLVEDLRNLLNNADIEPPYVLVGHSFGAMNVRLFAHSFPNDVIGIVLIDPSDENQVTRTRSNYPEKTDEQWQDEIESFLDKQRNCLRESRNGFEENTIWENECRFNQYKQLSEEVKIATEEFQKQPKFWEAQVSELENFYTLSAKQLRAVRKSFGDLPLIVLTATRTPPSTNDREKLAKWKKNYEVWIELHKEQAKLSSRGIQKIVTGAGHQIALDRPEIVVQAVLKVIKESSSR